MEREDVCRVEGVAAADGLGGVESPPALEHGQACEEGLLVRGELLVGPVDGRFQGAMVRKRVPARSSQEPEPVVDPPVDL